MSHRIYKERNNRFASYVGGRVDRNLNPGPLRVEKYTERDMDLNPFMLKKQERLSNHSWHYMSKEVPKANPMLPNYLPVTERGKSNIPLIKGVIPIHGTHNKIHPEREYRYMEQRRFKHY